MAKSIAFYYNQLVDLKHTQSVLRNQLLPNGDSSVENLDSLLSELNSSSKVGIWRLWAWIMATFAWITDTSFDTARVDLQYTADTALVGNNRWLVDVAKDFRYNTATNNMVPLVIDAMTKASVYANPTLQPNEIRPITVATVIKSNAGFTNLLIAKTVSGNFAKLNINEMNAFRDYLTKYKQFAGTNIQINSQDGDILKYNLSVRFDFTLGTPNPEVAIKTAIINALKNIDFNGKLERLKLDDAIQAVPGVQGITGTYSARGFDNLGYITFQDFYQTLSGYINVSNVPSEQTITLIAND